MRRRFFVLILSVLVVVSMSSLIFYKVFLRSERLKLVDQQVRETAAALLDSQLTDLRQIDFDKADEIISEELGESRIGKFFIIRNSRGETVFESASARLLPVAEVPNDQQWFQISKNGKFIRGLNLKLPRVQDRTLQVGLVLDENILDPGYFSQSSLVFLGFVISLGLIVSYALTSFLLRPMAMLDRFLSNVTVASRSQALLPEVPDTIFRKPDSHSRDEFERVVAGLNTLIGKVNKNYEFSRLWAYQMAHELKTPLSLANLEVERLQKRLAIAPNEFDALNEENGRISETINTFLSWAELENSNQQRFLYMNNLGNLVQETVERLKVHNTKILVNVSDSPDVPANPQHLTQLIQNLVVNSLLHSQADTIEIKVSQHTLEISDNGIGFPSNVLERLGEPFNKGNLGPGNLSGHGLGLAWVYSICRIYGWEIVVSNRAPGAVVAVHFKTR